jgi:hypothetical protein
MGQSIPFACQDWANTKAAYRFLANDRVREKDILSGHFHATRERFASSEGSVLVLLNTTTFSYQRDRPEFIGFTGKSGSVKDKEGHRHALTACGMLMPSSLAVITQGKPLGLAAVKFWTRSQLKGCNALEKTINPTRTNRRA